MKEKELFIKALNTLLYSWGGDTWPEAIWAANDLLKWYEAEFSVKLNVEFSEDGAINHNYEAVIDAINKN